MECTLGMVLYTACEVAAVDEDTRVLAVHCEHSEDGRLWYLLSRCGQVMKVDEGELMHSGMFHPSDERADVTLELGPDQDPFGASMLAYQCGKFDAPLRLVRAAVNGTKHRGEAR
ncbi:hypothetical protein ACN8ZM_40260 (plasmid) [Burkholderia aenigmatica]|uniref:hypothetical protein n=1 Tax=Burkholderia aenigmatica TaxID=2015348 RepID=UPI003B427A94